MNIDFGWQKVCAAHCCPIHGCKYGYMGCPVESGKIEPYYQANNGCEYCEEERKSNRELMERTWNEGALWALKAQGDVIDVRLREVVQNHNPYKEEL